MNDELRDYERGHTHPDKRHTIAMWRTDYPGRPLGARKHFGKYLRSHIDWRANLSLREHENGVQLKLFNEEPFEVEFDVLERILTLSPERKRFIISMLRRRKFTEDL